jgi:glycosyltransferase involved in cell wall biosynthesis
MHPDVRDHQIKVSVVTPTLHRPAEVVELIENLSQQTQLPFEMILVDGAAEEETETYRALKKFLTGDISFPIKYVKHGGGTAIQRNTGIDAAVGEFVAFVDDDIRLAKDFLEQILLVFREDGTKNIGGIVGYRTNQYFTPQTNSRWQWYKRLSLLSTYEPGMYDFQCGYPINVGLQPPFHGTRPVDFMTTSCAVWRREVIDSGIRFDHFFRDYGVMEDAHFSLRARKLWVLLQCGDAQCVHLHSPRGRVNRQKIGYKFVVNYYYVFQDIAGPLSRAQKLRFWRYQLFEVFRITASAIRRFRKDDIRELFGRFRGFVAIVRDNYLDL